MSDFVQWDNKFKLGITLIDSQHRHLIELTNSLFAACLLDKDKLDQKFKEVMKEAVEYVMVHFKDEEELMLWVNYPVMSEHKKKHEEFIRTILDSANDYKNGKKFVPNSFVRFLRDWLLNHIAITDREFANYYLSQRKNAPELNGNI